MENLGGGVIGQREGTPLGESNQKQGLAVGIPVYLQFVLSTQSLSASRLPICEMKEIETNLPPRVSTQCNALKKKKKGLHGTNGKIWGYSGPGLTSVRWRIKVHEAWNERMQNRNLTMSHPKGKDEKDIYIYRKENWKLWNKSPRGMLTLRGVIRLCRLMSGVHWESPGMAVFARSGNVYNCGWWWKWKKHKREISVSS